MRAVQLGTTFQPITLIHPSPFVSRPGKLHEVRHRCNITSIHDDAVNRNCVSSSPSESIFEALRDSEILGSETLKLSGMDENLSVPTTSGRSAHNALKAPL